MQQQPAQTPYAAHLVDPKILFSRTRRMRIYQIVGQLKNDRATFEGHWRELAEHLYPRVIRFQTSDINKGDKRNQKIIDSTGTLAIRDAAAGMMSGVTSPARRWFDLETRDVRMMDVPAVRAWCYAVAERMSKIFNRSNVYKVLPGVYKNLFMMGSPAMYVEESETNVLRARNLPIGSYWLATNEEGTVDCFYREFTMTARQLVDTFAYDREKDEIDWTKVSVKVRRAYENMQFENRWDVCHIIYPNELYNPRKAEAQFKKFASCYFEKGTSSNTTTQYFSSGENDIFLRESGYDEFPVLCPAWERTGEDTYSTSCPGMEVLGDLKQLQAGEKKGLQAVDKQIDPPMRASSTLKNEPIMLIPGGVTYGDEVQGKPMLEPVYQVQNFRIDQLEMKQERVRDRIHDAFFITLWRMFTNRQEENPPTATQVQAQNDEKLLLLGPVLESVNKDLLTPLINIAFRYMLNQGLIPPPPKQIQGQQLNVVFVSIIAQAQKLGQLSNIDRFLQTVAQMAQVDQQVLDTINFEQIVNRYADRLSIEPGIVRSLDQIKAIRDQRNQAMAQQQAIANAQGAAKAAKDVGSVDMNQPNALQSLLQQRRVA